MGEAKHKAVAHAREPVAVETFVEGEKGTFYLTEPIICLRLYRFPDRNGLLI